MYIQNTYDLNSSLSSCTQVWRRQQTFGPKQQEVAMQKKLVSDKNPEARQYRPAKLIFFFQFPFSYSPHI